MGSNNYSYDDNGNVLSDGTYTYIYGDYNKLKEVKQGTTKAAFTYDALGRRANMIANAITKTFHYDGDLVTYVTQSDGKVYRFSYDHSGRPIFMSYNNNQYWYHYDQHGSVIRMTDKDGKTIAKYKYDAWGNNTYKWGTTGTGSEIVNLNPYRYSGYWYDSEIDKYYLKARYYDAEIGRFLAKDPIAVLVGDSLSLNSYTYAGNNPVMFVDPSREILAIIVAGALFGMAIFGESYLWSTRNGGGTVSGFAVAVIEGGVTGATTVVAPESVLGAVSKHAIKSTKFLKNAPIVKNVGKTKNAVIGKVADLREVGKYEYTLLDKLPNKGLPKANWKQNSGVLRSEMNKGNPIRDASNFPNNNTGFLNAERNLLQSKGWTNKNGFWYSPKGGK